MKPDAPAPFAEPTAELEQLYRARSRALAARISRRAGTDEGLDIVHEAFARLLGSSSEVQRAIACTEAFLARISSNLFIDGARRRATGQRWTIEAEPSLSHDQVAYLESRDTLRRLEAALLKLNPVTSEVFIARRVEGLSYAEIAARTGLSVKAVEKRMAKAIAKLSRLMDRD
jgi:RNA polymerase sigma-70 factor (ECF subfamily)